MRHDVRTIFHTYIQRNCTADTTSVGLAQARPIKLTSLNDFPLEEVPVSPTGQFKQSLDSFYVTNSPLSVTNNAHIGMFYLNLPVLLIFP